MTYLATDSDDRPEISTAAQGQPGGSPLKDCVCKNYVLFLHCLGKTEALSVNSFLLDITGAGANYFLG